MKYTVGIKEIKEIYHEIEVDIKNNELLNEIEDVVNMGDFDDIEDVADYIEEIAHVYSVDDNYTEISKGFVCEEISATDY